MYGLTTRRKDSVSPGSGTRTPVADFGNAIVLRGTQADEELYFAEGLSSDEDLAQPQTNEGVDNKDISVVLEEEKSGIGWKFANQGMPAYAQCPYQKPQANRPTNRTQPSLTSGI